MTTFGGKSLDVEQVQEGLETIQEMKRLSECCDAVLKEGSCSKCGMETDGYEPPDPRRVFRVAIVIKK